MIIIDKILNPIKNIIAEPNEQAIFIFGMQKAGTSAIAALLAKKTGLSVTIDTEYLWEPYFSKIENEEILLEDHINKKSFPFSKDIIKEPEATYIIEEIDNCFDLNKYVFVIRNPFQNIRSVLNRLHLPGDLNDININKVPKVWKRLFPGNGENYISDLAENWVKAYSKFDYIKSDSCVIVIYEDFIKNKERSIDNLSINLDLQPKFKISHIKDKQFQPKGEKNCDINKFFGKKNKEIIKKTCGELMAQYGYY